MAKLSASIMEKEKKINGQYHLSPITCEEGPHLQLPPLKHVDFL